MAFDSRKEIAALTGARESRALRLRAELDRIRAVLAELPSVEQVAVFGSVAAGHVGEWSDLDMMVVQLSEEPFIERAAQLARLIRPQVGVQFLVYTPAEIRELADRKFVQVEILQKGKVLPMNPRDEARRWLEFAGEDLRMTELAVAAAIFNQACFHAQQCVEKCLKACLAGEGELLPRTRLIADLVQQLGASARGLLDELEAKLLGLDQFYIPTRYPDAIPGSLPEGLPQKRHADEALETARLCYQRVMRLVG